MKPSLRSLLVSVWALTLAWPLAARAASPADAPPGKGVLTQEASAFVQRIKAGEIAALPDDDLLKAFKQLNPEVIASYLEIGAQAYAEYELWMSRQERLGGSWPAKPFLNHIKYRQQPRQVYIKWLEGGPKAGQEIIFDESKRKDAMFGHIGGLFNVVSIWTPVSGAMARSNSNHTVADLGVQSMVAIVVADRGQYLAEGRRPYPDAIEVARLAGQRTVALTWIAPSPQHYAHKTKVYLDLQHPLMRGIEAWADDGSQTERIVLDKIVPASFTDVDFDPGNKAYGF
jgi:hypothetical protein